jgi:hypothetical protein
MRYLKYLQRAGLVFVLLIGGVVAGMIPLYSEAQAFTVASTPHLYIEVYLGTSTTPAVPRQEIALGNAVSCATTAQNYCYPLTTAAYNNTVNSVNQFYGPVGHKFQIADHTASNPARVNINDKQTVSNSNPSDIIIVTGMKLLPTTTWGQYDVVTVKLIVTNKFDAQPNPVANGTSSFYAFGMSVGGTYNTSPSPAGNFYQMYGRAVFTGTLLTGPWTNLQNVDNPHADFSITRGASDPRCAGTPLGQIVNGIPGTKYPLCQYIAGSDSLASRFNSSQDSSNYPGGSISLPLNTRFACTNNLTGSNKEVRSTGNTNETRPAGPVGTISIVYTDPTCQAFVEETHVFSIWGPDQIWLTGSSHAGGGVCGSNPLPSCECTETKGKKESMCNAIAGLITAENKKEVDDAGPTVHPVIECTDEICSGQIDVSLVVNGAPIGMRFPFIGLGPGLGPFSITITGGTGGNATGELTDPFVKLITGHGGAEGGGTPLLFMPDYNNPDWPRPDGNSFYALDQMHFESANGSTAIDTDTFVDSCNGDKGPGFVFSIGRTPAGQADHLRLRIHIHSEQSAGSVCPF